MFSVEGLSVLVTGSSGGIGRSLAIAFAEHGARVVVHGRRQEACDQTADLVRSAGAEVAVAVGELTNLGSIESVFAQARDAFGGLDVLVNNAGAQAVNWFDKMTEEEWDSVVDTNLKAPFFCSQLFARQMRDRRFGRIVNIGSESCLIGGIGNSQYVASKAGLMGLTINLALEMAVWARKDPGDYTCNLVHPGYNETEMAMSHSDEQKQRVITHIPLGRPANTKNDVAPSVLFLASRQAAYVTGAKFSSGGGYGMSLVS